MKAEQLGVRAKLLALAGGHYTLDIAGLAAGETDAFVKEHIRMNLERDPTVQTIEVSCSSSSQTARSSNLDDVPLDLHSEEALLGQSPR